MEITKDFVFGQYVNFRKSNDCFYYLDGYFVGLLDAHKITEDQYKTYRAWNEEGYNTFVSGDNDE